MPLQHAVQFYLPTNGRGDQAAKSHARLAAIKPPLAATIGELQDAPPIR
jgi:hypothetical protein